uniref:guanylate cyclase n=1 Tax=Caenorhabditis tropicalis TaxID=1561998 RepID=A0A1I7TGB6_9PELO
MSPLEALLDLLMWVFEQYIQPFLPCGLCGPKPYEVPWKVDKLHLKIIVNKNADSKMQRELENKNDEKAEPDAFTQRRRIFGSYAIVNEKRAEFIQFTQVDRMNLESAEIDLLISLRTMNNANLTTFFGVQFNDESLHTFTILHVLVERCTLEEFCLDEQFVMNQTYMSGFMRDILEGLDFLHNKSKIKYHGHLLAATCLIDINWVLKLSLFGISNLISKHFTLGTIKNYDSAPPMLAYHQYICLPPEHISKYDTTGKLPPRMVPGDDKGDMYCLGMIIYMMLTRIDPFEVMNSHERTNHLVEILNNNKRPKFRDEAVILPKKDQMEDDELIINRDMFHDRCTECWDRDREKRPKIIDIAETLRDAFPFSQGTLVDQLVRRTEKYAEKLEVTVEQRTFELSAARQMTMKLLNEMLPRDISEMMSKGLPRPPPRAYDSATVMFVQICEFPKIMKLSSPHQVETTGETYMLASGVPEENEGRHVVEVAELSLKIREVSYRFELEHIPNRKINIRIGFHAGPIAAGVIGIRAPRYCLFGDTVNFASRMQSNCPPNQIQTSEVNCFWLNEHVHHDPLGVVDLPDPVTSEPSTSGLPIPSFQLEQLDVKPKKKVLRSQRKQK